MFRWEGGSEAFLLNGAAVVFLRACEETIHRTLRRSLDLVHHAAPAALRTSAKVATSSIDRGACHDLTSAALIWVEPLEQLAELGDVWPIPGLGLARLAVHDEGIQRGVAERAAESAPRGALELRARHAQGREGLMGRLALVVRDDERLRHERAEELEDLVVALPLEEHERTPELHGVPGHELHGQIAGLHAEGEELLGDLGNARPRLIVGGALAVVAELAAVDRADPDHVLTDREHADLVDRVDVARGIGPGLALRLAGDDLLHEPGRRGAVHGAVIVEDDASGDPDLLDQRRAEHVVGVARVVASHDLFDRERRDPLGPGHHGDGLAEDGRGRRERRGRGARRRGGRCRGVGVQDVGQHEGEAFGDLPTHELHDREALERRDGGVAPVEEVVVEGLPAHLDTLAPLVDRGVVGIDDGLGGSVTLVECGRHFSFSPSPTDSPCRPVLTRKAS